ncbi:TPA: hypothetical protein EYN98_33575 [Candidatus Poribacteria bacterium]|nr:hypothetical protein [Candidatus Poribacteria bacterium]HIB86821.1 hypothetical protein [Candidatus Poribacteria bacterium]
MRSIHVFVFLGIAVLLCFVSQAYTAEISWEAEKFIEKKGDSLKVYKAGFKAKGNPDENVKDFVISQASGGSFVGQDNGVAADGSWLKYEFSVPVGGDWYLWGKVIAPSVADNSVHWGIDIADGDAKNADDDNCNIWDFFEAESLRVHYTTNWMWFRISSRSGNPFPGKELDQYAWKEGKLPTPLNLSSGKHTLHLIDREDGTFIDAFYASTDWSDMPMPTAVEAEGKLASTWAKLKQQQ